MPLFDAVHEPNSAGYVERVLYSAPCGAGSAPQRRLHIHSRSCGVQDGQLVSGGNAAGRMVQRGRYHLRGSEPAGKAEQLDELRRTQRSQHFGRRPSEAPREAHGAHTQHSRTALVRCSYTRRVRLWCVYESAGGSRGGDKIRA